MNHLRYIFLVLLLLGCIVVSAFIVKTNTQKKEVKVDLIEISNIKYGLFNVDEWKIILTGILSKKIEEFELKGNNRSQMKKKITQFLHKVIGEFEERYYSQNKGSIGGFFKNVGAHTFNIFGELKEHIPSFTDNILEFLNDPKNKKALKSYLTDKLNEYADNTFAKIDYTEHNAIIGKYHCNNRAEAISALNIQHKQLQDEANNYKYLLFALALLAATFVLLMRTLAKLEFILITVVCFLYLVLGLTLPMIEIDARVSEMRLSLLGEQINFEDQVLYYKSKSILEVVQLMITQGSFDLLLVGGLVFIFSVLFPLSKLIASVMLVTTERLKSNKVIQFLVFKTGKWSMADVMVVAIFMAYIGFSGILTEQLHQLENISQKLEVLTTNKSSLQTGFFAFASFVFLSLLTTNKLKSTLNQ